MRRYELTDEQWAVIEPLIPQAMTGPRLKEPRAMLNGMFWVLRSGAPWRDLPERFGPWQTVYHHFNSWRRRKVFERILQALQVRWTPRATSTGIYGAWTGRWCARHARPRGPGKTGR